MIIPIPIHVSSRGGPHAEKQGRAIVLSVLTFAMLIFGWGMWLSLWAHMRFDRAMTWEQAALDVLPVFAVFGVLTGAAATALTVALVTVAREARTWWGKGVASVLAFIPAAVVMFLAGSVVSLLTYDPTAAGMWTGGF